MRISTALLVFLAIAWLPVPAAMAYTITLNGFDTSFLETRANDGSGGNTFEIVYPAALPYSYTSSSVSGGASSESEYDLSSAGFDITFDHSRVSELHSYAYSQGQIFFSVDQAINYSAIGAYSEFDPDANRFEFHVYLFDYTQFSYVFQSDQKSRSTPNESFTLGLTGGDDSNINTGSLTGTLIPGHDYLFFHAAIIDADSSASTAATASGSVSLSFTPVPEPGTAVLLSMGLVGLMVSRCRARTHEHPSWRKTERAANDVVRS